MRTSHLLTSLIFVVAACGGDDSPANPDAQDITPDAPNVELCPALTTPVGTISTFPGMYAGTVKGAGADLSVGDGVCAPQVGDAMGYFEPVGEDVVVKLTGLTVGMKYGVIVDTTEDLGFYVISGCTGTAAAPVVGHCDLFDDSTAGGEQAVFTASATEEYVVVDTADSPSPPATGAFTLHVLQAQCEDDTGCSGATPACESFTCTECHDSFQCTAAGMAVCGGDHTCGAGTTTCTGDDVRDNGTGDDGPASATMLALPTATPTTISGGICNSPASESDYYKIVLAADTDLGFQLTFTGATNDVDLYIHDSTGAIVTAGINNAGIAEQFVASLTAGTYYLEVTQYRPANTVAAVPYTLSINQIECQDEFGCTTAGAPSCGANGRCVAGPAQCVGDDAGDATAGGDDGPAGARTLTGAVGAAATLSGSICNSPDTERDYYKFTVLQGQGLDISLAWATADDLDVNVFDATGRRLGLSFYKTPEAVSLRYLPAGTYYIQVTLFAGAATTAVTPYTITATRTALQVCTTSTDCASTYSTQFYRGSCTVGACQFIPPGTRAAGVACDSPDDCLSDNCSYIPFESDAQKSVCTGDCATTADCAAIGTGLTCSTGLTQNFCLPSCANDLQCGADASNPTLTTGQPWGYFTCTVATNSCAF